MFRTENFEAYIASARRYPQIWRLVLGCISGFAVYFIGFMLIVAFFSSFFLFDKPTQALMLELGASPTPAHMAVLLSTFIPMALGALAMAAWHRRGLASLLGRRARFIEFFVKGALIIVGINACYFLYVAVFSDEVYPPNLAFEIWARNLLWALPLLFIQITAEELIFRGYLQQQIAARFKGFFWWMILPSALFAIGHFDPTLDASIAWGLVIATGLFGVIAADLTRLTGSLAAAMGLHFANNFFSMFLIGTPDKLSGLALYHSTHDMNDVEVMQGLLLLEIAILIVIWIIARRVVR